MGHLIFKPSIIKHSLVSQHELPRKYIDFPMAAPPPHRQSSKNMNTWLRCNLTIVAIAILKRFRPRQSTVLFLTDRIRVKYSPFHHLSEGKALQFIASNTSVPVPKVYCTFER